MILVFRALLFVLAFVFCFLLGSTSEGLLLEVVRRFVSVDPSNAVFFNSVLLAAAAVPVLLFGAIGSVSLSGEKIWNRRLWQTVAGLLGALISVRMFQVWQVLKGGGGPENNAVFWTETGTFLQQYTIEKILPFAFLGLFSALPAAFFEESNRKMILISLFNTVFAFFWLWGSKKVLMASGMGDVFQAFLAAVLTSFLAVFLVQKTKTF